MAAPANTSFEPGVGVASADNLNTFAQFTTNLDTLRAFASAKNYMVVVMLGTAVPGDGGQAIYYWNAASTGTDNGTTIVAPTGMAMGRWLRLGSVL